MLEQYAAAGLVQPWSGEYENDFEKQIFMAINLCRHDPKRFVPHVRAVYKDHVLLNKGAGKKMNDLIAKLQSQAPLRPVRFDGQANDAVRQNNLAVVAADEAAPKKGGNIAKYNQLVGSDKTSSCREFTMPQFEGSTGFEFVSLQLALDYEAFDAPKPEGAPKAKDAAAEPKANAMEEGSAPDKGQTEAKPAAKAPTAAPSYSPILDENIELVGISNKAHKKTKNVIQVLYVKNEGNAMV